MWASLFAALGRFLAPIIAKLIPAIGKELRKNNKVELKGYDNETDKTISDAIWNDANSDDAQQWVQQNVQADSSGASASPDSDN
jgi:hypothetical protein